MVRNCIFIAFTLVAFFAGGCSAKPKPRSSAADVAKVGSDLKKRIRHHVEDKAVREQLYFLVDEADRTMTTLKVSYLSHQRAFQTNPMMSEAEAQALSERFAVERIEAVRAIINLRLEMRKYVTKQQWRAIFTDEDEEGDGDDTPQDSPEKRSGKGGEESSGEEAAA